jgi:drug/metabolite transporter (DMT)-like permease
VALDDRAEGRARRPGGVFTAMLPVSAASVGVLVLGEQLGLLQVLAFAAALLGVVLATAPSPSGSRA